MSKIKKHDEHVSHFAYVTYFKDEGMYKVKASVHVNIEEASKPSKERGYENFHEVTDVDLEFFVNDKNVTMQVLKIYTKNYLIKAIGESTKKNFTKNSKHTT